MGFEILDGSLVSRGEGWLSAWVGKEYVMMSADTGTCISLSETGGRIWELMEQPRTVADLCHLLMTEYQAEREEVHADLMAFLEQMQEEQAVSVQEPG
jgi:hypothetical protein